MATRAFARVFLMGLVGSFLFLPAPRAADQVPGAPEGIEWVYSRPAGIEFTKSEVTVAQYRACVKAGRCTKPETKSDFKHYNWGYGDRDKHPINGVDWNQAKSFCEWAGGRLPTEKEWEAEASNKGSRKYPWGAEEVSCDRVIWGEGKTMGCGRGSTWPVCSKTSGNSVSGLCDMSGNVWEWTSSWYSEKKEARVVRGGAWFFANIEHFRASYRLCFGPTSRSVFIGVRCGRASLETKRKRGEDLKAPYNAAKATKGGASDQLLAWERFIVDYPENNPYLKTARRKIAGLKARALKKVKKTGSGSEGLQWVYSRPAGIDFTKSEVTVAQYRACMKAGRCTKPGTKNKFRKSTWGHKDRDKHPIDGVDWNQAKAFCEWAGGRLPTEKEWEAEASNKGSRKYPWGAAKPTCIRVVMKKANKGCGRDSTWPVCSKACGNSVSGLCDMGGNVWEWTSSWYSEKKEAHVVRGGAWGDGNTEYFRASHRAWQHPLFDDYDIGVRCGRASQ